MLGLDLAALRQAAGSTFPSLALLKGMCAGWLEAMAATAKKQGDTGELIQSQHSMQREEIFCRIWQMHSLP